MSEKLASPKWEPLESLDREQYEKLYSDRIYANQDEIVDVVPTEKMLNRARIGLGPLKPNVGEVRIRLNAVFFKKDPKTKDRLLRGNHASSFVSHVNTKSEAANFNLYGRHVPSNDYYVQNVRAMARIPVTELRETNEKVLSQLTILLHESLDFAQVIKIDGTLARGKERIPIFAGQFVSDPSKHLVPEQELSRYNSKLPYQEAYNFKNFSRVIAYYNQTGDLIGLQSSKRLVKVRCLRPVKMYGELIRGWGTVELTQDKVFHIFNSIEKIDSSIVRGRDNFKLPLNYLDSKESIVGTAKRFWAFEFIDTCYPEYFLSLSADELNGFVYQPLLDFDNKKKKDYSFPKFNVNAFVEGLKEDVGLEGLTVCGTGTSSFGAHGSWFQTYPEMAHPPDSPRRLEYYLKEKNHPRIYLESLNTALRAMALKLIISRRLNLGVDPQNEREIVETDMIVEPRMVFRTGYKAIGTLNGSRTFGAKNILDENRMPERQEEYERQTSAENVAENLGLLMAKVRPKSSDRKFAKQNFERMAKYVREGGIEIYQKYRRMAYRNPWWVTVTALRKTLQEYRSV